MSEAGPAASDSVSSTACSDDSLAASVVKGDDFAFEELFERHKRRVARIAGRFFNRPERVEEIVQETFAKMYFGLPEYSPRRGTSFTAWLNRIAINACYDQLRRTKRRPENLIDPEDEALLSGQLRALYLSSSPDAETSLISRDLVGKLLARLKPDDRVVLILLDAEEMQVTEIAQMLGWSESKVKVRAHRARASLRRVLSEFI